MNYPETVILIQKLASVKREATNMRIELVTLSYGTLDMVIHDKIEIALDAMDTIDNQIDELMKSKHIYGIEEGK